MSWIWNFVKTEENRKVLAWAGGGFTVIAAGLWAVYLHFSAPKGQGDINSNVTTSCGSFGTGGDVRNGTIIISNTGNCFTNQTPNKQ